MKNVNKHINRKDNLIMALLSLFAMAIVGHFVYGFWNIQYAIISVFFTIIFCVVVFIGISIYEFLEDIKR